MQRPSRTCRGSTITASAFAHDRQHTLQNVCEKWGLSPTGGLIKSLVKAILMYTSYRKQYVSVIGTITPRNAAGNDAWDDNFRSVVQTLLDKVGTFYFPYSLPIEWQNDFWGEERPVWLMDCDREKITTGMLLLFEFLRDNDHGLDLSSAEVCYPFCPSCFVSKKRLLL